MEAIGMYLLKSAAWLTGFALVYLLVLRNEHFFRLNRVYLLAGIIASLLFPFYTFHYAVILPAITTSAYIGELSVGMVVQEQASPLTIYFWIYLIGSLAFLFRLLFQTWKIIRKLQKAGYERSGAVKLVRTPEFVSSFSFFSFVFVNPSIATQEMEEIMNHEREHIQQRHWFDLLLVELICIVQWFNPFAWIYAHLIRQNHEFLADESALQRTTDPAIYQAALLNQLLGVPVFSLTNSFSYSLNKKRFKMMKKKIDSPFRKFKMLLVLPLAAMLFYAFAVPEYQYGSGKGSVVPEGKTIDVKGRVFKSDGSTPLHGTSVILKGSTIGTLSDKDGNFLLNGIPAEGELVFSFVGFQTKFQKVEEKPMKIVMEVSKIGLDQVTVVGYGTPPPPPPLDYYKKQMEGSNPPLFYLDGVLIDKKTMEGIKPDQIESISILKDKSATAVYGDKGKNGVILIKTKRKAWMEDVVAVGGVKTPPGTTPPPSKVAIRSIDDANPPLFFLDGVQITKAEMDKINPDQIASINVVKDKSATESYGVKAKNGVILIVTKEKASNIKQLFSNYSEQMVEEMPQFPGGQQALNDFLASVIVYPADAVKNNIQGRVMVTFTVKSDGTVGNAKISSGVHPLLDNEAIRVVNLSPAWKPGKSKGLPVTATYTIPVVFALDAGKLDKKKIVADPVVPPQRPDGVFVVVEQMPEFPGGELALRKFIAETIKYPADAIKDGIQGKVYVTFVVKSDGSVGDAKIARGVHALLDNEAIRVINLLPKWKPGKQKGKEVNVSYTIPVQFALDGGKSKETATSVPPKINEKGEKEVFVVVEEMPEFPGGAVELRQFIARSVKYPAEAIKEKAQGKVFVSFVVNSTGKVENAKIQRSVSPALDAEAIRVISLMPEWKPGKQRGQAVSVEYTMPIEFKLQ